MRCVWARESAVWLHVMADKGRDMAGNTGTEFLDFAGDPFGHRLTEHHGGKAFRDPLTPLFCR